MFTIEIRSGYGNVLKSFITALSVGSTNIKCRPDAPFPADFSQILDDSHICHGSHEYYQPHTSCRLLVLASEDNEQCHIDNDMNRQNNIDIPNTNIHHLFSKKNIDWSYDRALICDTVFNRIVKTIDIIKWRPEILAEVENVTSQFIHPVLTINIRTWSHKNDPPNLCIRTDDPCRRAYNFETYKAAIESFLPECKTIVLSTDSERVLPEYLDLLKNHNVIFYSKKSNITDIQYSAINMLVSSACNFMVCSRLSTYSECIWWFSHCKQKVIALW